MTKNEILKMAKQAGFERLGHDDCDYVCYPDEIEAFAKLVAEKERQACAKICDDELKEWGIFDSDVGDVSKAIRARGQT